MTEITIHNGQVEQQESEKLEFKESLMKGRILEAVGAFANRNGGVILVGVSKQNVVGVSMTEASIRSLVQSILNNTDPQHEVSPHIKDVTNAQGEEVQILRIEVKEATDKPVIADGRVWRRIGASNRKIKKRDRLKAELFGMEDKLYCIVDKLEIMRREIEDGIKDWETVRKDLADSYHELAGLRRLLRDLREKIDYAVEDLRRAAQCTLTPPAPGSSERKVRTDVSRQIKNVIEQHLLEVIKQLSIE